MSEHPLRKSPDPKASSRPQPGWRHRALAAALRKAFLRAQSENGLSLMAAGALQGNAGITDRAIRRWLNGETYPRAGTMGALAVLTGAEVAMDITLGKASR